MADVTDYKRKAMRYAAGDDLLVRALVRGTQYEGYLDEPERLVGRSIYPYLLLNGSGGDAGCSLLFEVNEYEHRKTNGSTVYKDMELVAGILCHTSLMEYDGATRPDYISGRLDSLLNKNPHFGSGRLCLKSNIAGVTQSGEYHYRTITYETRHRIRAIG